MHGYATAQPPVVQLQLLIMKTQQLQLKCPVATSWVQLGCSFLQLLQLDLKRLHWKYSENEENILNNPFLPNSLFLATSSETNNTLLWAHLASTKTWTSSVLAQPSGPMKTCIQRYEESIYGGWSHGEWWESWWWITFPHQRISTHCSHINYSQSPPKSHGLTAWLWLFRTPGQAKATMKPSSWPSLAWPIWGQLGLAHGLRPGQAQH